MRSSVLEEEDGEAPLSAQLDEVAAFERSVVRQLPVVSHHSQQAPAEHIQSTNTLESPAAQNRSSWRFARGKHQYLYIHVHQWAFRETQRIKGRTNEL